MTHEPECDAYDPQSCICHDLRAAYQRGRVDAAQAVAAVKDYHGSDSVLVNRHFAANAARGDGEQPVYIDEMREVPQQVVDAMLDGLHIDPEHITFVATNRADGEQANHTECCCNWADSPSCRSCKCCNGNGEQA